MLIIFRCRSLSQHILQNKIYPVTKMDVNHIKNLAELLRDYLGPDRYILDTKTSPLTPPRENFGGIMLKLDLKLKNKKTDSEEMLYAVAKTLPETEHYRKIFNIQVTYTNEKAFYETIVPTLKNFQKEQGANKPMNLFATLYGSRLNLEKDSDIVDDDAVLVWENLGASGFSNITRWEGFDLHGAKLILKDLAEFHAVPLALKLKKPDVFREKVLRTCNEYLPLKETTKLAREIVTEILLENNKSSPLISKISMWGEKPGRPVREPFATLTHDDLWVNNTMQKFENGCIVENKFVDFQVYKYGSPAMDAFFFLWTSVQLGVLDSHLDFLLKYYHENFIENLEKLKCDTAPFGFEKFLEEIKIECGYEFGHAIFFATFIVFGKKGGSAVDLPPKEKFLKYASRKAKEKAWYMAEECNKRGWL